MEKKEMKQYDLEKLERAILYVQRIADGCNPINNVPVEESSVLHNPNVIRCMYFIKEVLEDVDNNNGYVGRKSSKSNKKLPFPIEAKYSFNYTGDKAISKLADQINESLDTNVYKQLSYKTIAQWLVNQGFLQEIILERYDNKMHRVPTEKGLQLGIRTEEKTRKNGMAYLLTIYGKQAQEFIVENLGLILDGKEKQQNVEDTTDDLKQED